MQAVDALEKTSQFLTLGHYSEMTIRNYLGELRYLFSYYRDVPPLDFNSDMVMQYLLYLTKTLECGRSKCCMAAQSISFFFRHVLQKPYVIPTLIYPRKVKTLPAVMTAEEIMKVINTIQNVKHRAMFMLLYSTGIRLSELAHLRITDIDSKAMRVKVVQGKGAKDRYTILSEQVLLELRAYYVQYRPVEYLFNGMGKGRRYSQRSIEKAVENAIIKAGLENKHYTVHTIRHSFATHLVDNGTDVHTVKELLGHNSIGTTMQYLHMSTRRMNSVVNPYDLLPADDPDLR
ncbi:MAG: tyrosine-type recombinase/integrase [Segetibacter sp.]